MTIDRQSGQFVFMCDSCDATFERPQDEGFDTAVAAARDEGWRATKVGSVWEHSCPDCHED